MNSKIQPTHLERSALVYVRQSTLVQVQRNQESTRMQYDLRVRAQELGWRSEKVAVIDEDQGRSGETTHGRTGFARVMSEVALGEVGIVLAIEASRLARNNADWQRLILFCSLTETLLGDQDNVYDPSSLDDRMVLGLKGTISEQEWHHIIKRMRQAALSKARRGELRFMLPAGLEWEGDRIEITPDKSVVDTLRLVFDTFDEAGSARQVALRLYDRGVKLPRRAPAEPGMPVRWTDSTAHAVYQILTQPMYAGVYRYGHRKTVRQIDAGGTVRKREVRVDRSEYKAFLLDHHVGLVDWERFERIQKQLRSNMTKCRHGEPGPAREGSALLQGLAYCGKCGRKMSVAYHGKNRRFSQFVCSRVWSDRGTQHFCQVLGGRKTEEKVVALFLEAVQPAGVDVGLHAVDEIEKDQEWIAEHWQQRIRRAEYETERARERYDAVDARNRLVAEELERRWEDALAEVEGLRREADEQLQRLVRPLTELDRERVRRMSENVAAVWNAPSTTSRDRKRLLRAAIDRVILDAKEETVKVAVHWKGGEVNELEVKRQRRGDPGFVTDAEVVSLIRRFAGDGLDDTQIAQALCRRKMRTASGFTFTKRRVQSVRSQYKIPCGTRSRSDLQEPSYTAEEAAGELGVSSTTVHTWLREGLLRGRQVAPGAPWRIVLDQETRRRLAGEDAPEDWVGLEAAARRLGVSKQTVATWVKRGKLEAVRVRRGRRAGWRIRVDATGLEKQEQLL